MATVAKFVQVNLSATSPGITRAGYGVPLILGTPTWSSGERTRSYSDISGVAADFAATRPEYLAAARMFQQSPRPPKVLIGRLANKPTMAWDITPAAVNSFTYKGHADTGKPWSYVSDGTATLAEVTAGIKAAIDALALALTVTTPANTSVHVVANNAGDWFDFGILEQDMTNMLIAQSTADPGLNADLTAIYNEDRTWYSVVNPWESLATIEAVAAWVETNGRAYVYSTQDSEVMNHALSGATDVIAAVKALAYKRSMGVFHPDPGAWAAAAWQGACLPLDAGTETWAHKGLVGVRAVALTDNQRTNVLAKNGNVYEDVQGVGNTFPGKVSDGEYFDFTRGLDAMVSAMQEDVFTAKRANAKIAFTNKGIQLIASKVRNNLDKRVHIGFLEPDYNLSIPTLADLDPADKAARTLKGLAFTAVAAGAIHTTIINGSVTE